MKRMRLKHERFPMARKGFNKIGRHIKLLTNHFQVTVAPPTDGYFYIYIVTIKRADGVGVGTQVMRREILDRVAEIYKLELAGRSYAYDGGRSLFTAAPLFEQNLLRLDIIVDHVNANHFTYNVSITFDKKIPMKIVANVDGEPPEQFQVLDAILRQNAATQGYFVMRQAWFPHEARSLDGGIAGYRGHSSRFRVTQGGFTWNIDASTALIISGGPLRQFLLLHQGVTSAAEIDWFKAKTTLKNLRINAAHSNMEYKITGLSNVKCSEQTFLFKRKTGGGETEEVEMTVYDYFVRHHNIQLHESGDFMCIDVGKRSRPIYIPIELCYLVPLQRYTEPLSDEQRAQLLNSWPLQGPKEKMDDLRQALLISNYGANSFFNSCGISISTEFTRVTGRVLTPPTLLFGTWQKLITYSGKWDIDSLKIIWAKKPERWVAVNFSSPCDMRKFCRDLVRCGEMLGYPIDPPARMLEEKPENASKPASVRVDEMIEHVFIQLGDVPNFLLCILPEKKNCNLYGPLNRKTLCEVGIVTQCVAAPCVCQPPTGYMRNVLLKINAKLKGLNWALCLEIPQIMPPLRIYEVPTLIIGLDVCHAPGKPSVAAVVGSICWPSLSRYVAVTRSQPPRCEIIQALYDKVSPTEDRGMIRELIETHCRHLPRKLPDRLIIFRDGVSESQFDQVLNVELMQIVEACKFIKESWSPKMMLVVAQKKHHTRFFNSKSPHDNVPPGTLVDTGVCHPRNNDFYLCAHAAIGTTRPTHYHVLCDEIGCTADEIQNFVHALSFVYQPSNKAVSIVAPIIYAHRAAAKMSRFLDSSQIPAQVARLPRLHRRVSSTMFFC